MNIEDYKNFNREISRRTFLQRSYGGLGGIALGSLLGSNKLFGAAKSGAGAQYSGLGQPGLPHFPPKAKRVIYLFMSGGPSHIDLFDYKPELKKRQGDDLPDSVRGEQRLTGMTANQKNFPMFGSLGNFAQHGKSGTWMSDLLPYTSQVVDDIAVVRSMHTEAINHDPGITLINTGSQIPGQPSAGAWASYGLGSSNQNMPSYVVLLSQGNGKNPGQPIFSRLWGSGFLPSSHQGVMLRSGDDPVLYLNNPPGITRENRRAQLDKIAAINEMKYAHQGDPEIATRISQYEMAFRMQAAAPEIADLSDEPQSTFDLYGEDAREPGTFAYNCLLSRRMAERGVRFSQLFHRGWDQHNTLDKNLRAQCKDTDQASAALVTDLKQRGMLDDTLVIWGGEFGRTAYSQGSLGSGRDHHGRCFSMWMAGGGIKGGTTYGETDDFGYNIVKDPAHIRDLNATMLHCLGIDHERFTFPFQGLDQRLTGVEHAHVIKGVLG